MFSSLLTIVFRRCLVIIIIITHFLHPLYNIDIININVAFYTLFLYSDLELLGLLLLGFYSGYQLLHVVYNKSVCATHNSIHNIYLASGNTLSL